MRRPQRCSLKPHLDGEQLSLSSMEDEGPGRPPATDLLQDSLFLQFYLNSSATQRLMLITCLGVCLRSQINNSGLLFKLYAQAQRVTKAIYKSCWRFFI